MFIKFYHGVYLKYFSTDSKNETLLENNEPNVVIKNATEPATIVSSAANEAEKPPVVKKRKKKKLLDNKPSISLTECMEQTKIKKAKNKAEADIWITTPEASKPLPKIIEVEGITERLRKQRVLRDETEAHIRESRLFNYDEEMENGNNPFSMKGNLAEFPRSWSETWGTKERYIRKPLYSLVDESGLPIPPVPKPEDPDYDDWLYAKNTFKKRFSLHYSLLTDWEREYYEKYGAFPAYINLNKYVPDSLITDDDAYYSSPVYYKWYYKYVIAAGNLGYIYIFNFWLAEYIRFFADHPEDLLIYKIFYHPPVIWGITILYNIIMILYMYFEGHPMYHKYAWAGRTKEAAVVDAIFRISGYLSLLWFTCFALDFFFGFGILGWAWKVFNDWFWIKPNPPKK